MPLTSRKRAKVNTNPWGIKVKTRKPKIKIKTKK